MQLEVFDVLGSSVCSLDDDSATLESLPIADGMKLHVSIQTTYRPYTDHIQTTYRPYTDHIQTIYKLPTCAPSAWLRMYVFCVN